MTLTNKLKILDDKIKANQAQYDLDREAAKVSALSSKELAKYEYLTGEALEYKLGVVEKVKFEYSPLGEALNNKAKCKTDQIDQTSQIDKTGKKDKNLFYNPKYSFERNLKISVILKKCHLILCIKGCKIFIKKLLVLKNLVSKQRKLRI